MPLDRYTSQHDAVISFKEFPGIFFTTKEGGEAQNEVSQQFPGGGGPPENITGPTTVTPVTITKPAEFAVDAPIIAWAKAWDRGVRVELTLIVQPVSSEGVPVGTPDYYHGCAKTSLSPRSVTKGSAEVSMLSITLQPRYIA